MAEKPDLPASPPESGEAQPTAPELSSPGPEPGAALPANPAAMAGLAEAEQEPCGIPEPHATLPAGEQPVEMPGPAQAAAATRHVNIPPPLRDPAQIRNQRQLAGRLILAGCALILVILIAKLLIPPARPTTAAAEPVDDLAVNPWRIDYKQRLEQILRTMTVQTGGQARWTSSQPADQPEHMEMVQLFIDTPAGTLSRQYLFDERNGMLRPMGPASGTGLSVQQSPFGIMNGAFTPKAAPPRPCPTCGLDLAHWPGSACPVCGG